MPTATDLVTDLPADFAVFGQAVDTSMAGLLGGTTGQVLSKTSGTNMAFTWVTPQVGDITAVTAGTGISGGGTTGDVTITNSMATAMTTSGDLIQATGSGTFARLGTGTNGQYLTTNGTTNSWGSISAGGMTLLSTTTLSGASTTISSISGSYKSLVAYVKQPLPATDGATLYLRLNGDSASRYRQVGYTTANSTVAAFSANQVTLLDALDNATTLSFAWFQIPDYANTTTYKMVDAKGLGTDQTTTTSASNYQTMTWYNQPVAITSLQFLMSSGNLTSGTVLLYGVN